MVRYEAALAGCQGDGSIEAILVDLQRSDLGLQGGSRHAQPRGRAGRSVHTSIIDIDKPRIHWLAMGKSMGCPSVRADNAGDFYHSMVKSSEEPRPMLIEVCL
jgi:hypothetical protein